MDGTNLYIDKLSELIKITTVIKIEDKNGLILGTDTFDSPDVHPSQLRFRDPELFKNLKPEWETIWSSFGDTWNYERQLFRYLHTESSAFFQSYKLFTLNFEEFVPLGFESSPEVNAKMEALGLNCELAIRSIYEYGKQAIDIIKKIDPNLLAEDKIFCNKFAETRNKFITHYHNASNYPDFTFDTSYWSVMGTSSLMNIDIHITNKREKMYTAFVNFRLDYFQLEEVLIKIFKKIAEKKK